MPQFNNMIGTPLRSTASRVFTALIVGSIAVGSVIAITLTWDRLHSTTHEAERVSHAVSTAVAQSLTSTGILNPESTPETSEFAATSERLQQFTSALVDTSDVSFITVMTPDGVRYTHNTPSEIGKVYSGTIPDSAVQLSETWEGTLGPSVRAITPILSAQDAQLVGWVSAGVTRETVSTAIIAELPRIAALTLIVFGIGSLIAVTGLRITRNLTGTLSTRAVREATREYASVQHLGSELRTQQHEHHNLVHTAIALIEVGRAEQAVQLLAHSVTHPRMSRTGTAGIEEIDSASASLRALIDTKIDRASQDGITITTSMCPQVTALGLAPRETITVIGNLIDNACDAARHAPAPRSVNVSVSHVPQGGTEIRVIDSGTGYGARSLKQLCRPGYSTKSLPPAETSTGSLLETNLAERGVGLALVQHIVSAAGGSLHLSAHPTTFTVTLPDPANSPDSQRTTRPA